MPPRLSVLLPVRDARPFLAEALASILDDPTAPDLEVVAVDDGSADGSAEVLAAAARRDRRLRVIPQPRLGLVAALNRGLGEARADLVARQDADDRSLGGRLRAIARYLDAEPAVAVVGTGVALHPDGARGAGMARYVDWLNAIDGDALGREIWVESPLAHPTIGARRAVLLAAGGYRQGPFAEDYELLLRLHLGGHRLGRIPEVLYWWRDHPGRLTRTHPSYAPPGFRRLKAAALRQGPLRHAGPVAVWGAGKTGRPFAAALRAEGFAVTAWIDVDPRKIGRTLHGAPVLPVDRVASVRGTPILVAVGRPEARPLIRAELDRNGFIELRDYWVVA
jgi:glycosyltransferase involved in cell wall biosynthesis